MFFSIQCLAKVFIPLNSFTFCHMVKCFKLLFFKVTLHYLIIKTK